MGLNKMIKKKVRKVSRFVKDNPMLMNAAKLGITAMGGGPLLAGAESAYSSAKSGLSQAKAAKRNAMAQSRELQMAAQKELQDSMIKKVLEKKKQAYLRSQELSNTQSLPSRPSEDYEIEARNAKTRKYIQDQQDAYSQYEN